MFLPASVTVYTDLCGTWSETWKTGFLATGLSYGPEVQSLRTLLNIHL